MDKTRYAYGVLLEPRATKDRDLFIRLDEENSKAVFQALAEFGAPYIISTWPYRLLSLASRSGT
jgi:hypothetical protein